MHRRSSWIVAAAGCAIALSACAPKDNGSKTASTAAPAAPNVVNVRAVDFAFEAPATIPAGVTTFKLTNAGTTFHHLVIARIDSGKTYADAQAAFKKPGPPPRWLTMVGGPNAPSPNSESNATIDMAPGEYALFCVVDLPGGVPHVAKGMIHPLTVTAATGPTAAMPTADIRVTLFDYNFDLSKPVTAGAHTFEVMTKPGQPHELELIKLAPGKTPDDVMKWMGDAAAGKASGPPPGDGVGGVVPATTGKPVTFSANFEAGATYMLICFMPDAKDNKPHFMHGMMQTFKIS